MSRCVRVLPMLLVLAVVTSLVPSARSAHAQTGFHVVRFTDRIEQTDLDALAGTGATVIDYVPRDGSLVWATPSQVSAASAMNGVRDIRPFEKRGFQTGGVVQVTAYGPAHDDLRSLVSANGTLLSMGDIRPDGLLVSALAKIDAPGLTKVAAHPAVLDVSPISPVLIPEDELTDQIQAGNVAANRTVEPGYRGWLGELGLDGSGVRVAVVDTGVDELHPDLEGKVVASFDYTPIGNLGDDNFPDDFGHGTHVAGIVAGNPGTITLTDRAGFEYGLGVAPGADIVDQNAIGTLSLGAGLSRLSADAWSAGARMWNASWHTGEGERVGYTASVRAVDAMARNADFAAPGSEEFLLVFSAGNAGNEGPTAPKEAKNIVAVGSTESGRGLLASRPGFSNENVSSFSSRGPTVDGRIFPTVSAPGGSVVSARGHISYGTLALCPTVDTTPLYASCSGTSMAAPHAAGAAALIHEWWAAQHGGALPSPAMVKALLVNGATDILFPDVPNNLEGWGRIDLSNTITDEPTLRVDQETTFTSPGEQMSWLVTPADAQVPLKITVAWTDAPAAVDAETALVNDLDLVVEQLDGNGSVVASWVGNHFSGGRSVTGGSPDRLNNLENVYLFPASGLQDATYRVTVSAPNLPGDGVPDAGDQTDQDFVLVARNAVEVP